MTANVRATSPEKLESVIELIHDCWFDYDEADPDASGITFDKQRKHVSIEYFYEDWDKLTRQRSGFFFKSKGQVPTYQAFLHINVVEHLEVVDRSQIGGSTFNTIRYDPAKQQLRILTNFDLDITATVATLDISVTVTDQSTGTKTVTEYLGGLIQGD